MVSKFGINTTWIMASIIVVLLGITVYTFVIRSKHATNESIVKHVEELTGIFEKINKTCGIIDFLHETNYVDFLTVKSFTGSQIGSMNLKYPDKWEGPYIQDNPVIQGKLYQIIKSKDAIIIAPGDGVELSNGKIIGKDIIINQDTDIEKFFADKETVEYKGKPLFARIAMSKESSSFLPFHD
jgi:uncharacterized protein YkvS